MAGNTTQTHSYLWWSPDGISMVPVSASNPLPVTGGGGGGGGAVTIADGANVVEGFTTDTAITTDSNGTISGKLRGLVKILGNVWDSVNSRLNVYIQNTSIAVTGTFWQATQPVSGSVGVTGGSVGLLAGSALIGKVGIDQTTPGTTNAVSVTNFPATQPVSGTVTANQGGSWTNTVTQGTAANLNATVVGTGTFATQSAQSGTWNIGTVSTVTGVTTAFGATAATVPANAGLSGLLGKTSNPTAVSDGQLVGAMADKLGRQVVVVGNVRDNKANTVTTITSSTSETTVITAVASTFLDVYGCIVENTSATGTKVTFKDSTSGTTQFEIYVPANDTRGFMLPSSDGFKQTTVNTNWTATCGTSVASIVITALYVKNT